MSKPVKLSFSHVGVFVNDLDKMLDFYTRVLGFVETDRGVIRGAPIVFTSQDPSEHHQVVLVGGRPEELPFNPINQLSFRVGSLEDLQTLYHRAKAETHIGENIRPVSHGYSASIYFPDPEGNRIEAFHELNWYVEQPVAEPLDLERPVEEIKAEIEAFCRRQPSCRPLSEWQAELSARIEERLVRADA